VPTHRRQFNSPLDAARKELRNFSCPIDLRCQNFVEAVDAWDEPAHVIWIGQSLHHLQRGEKRDFIRRVRAILPPDGLFLIWEPTCLEGEDREGWMERFRQMRPEWSMVTDDEFAAFDSHCRASDYAETAATWREMGRAAGFSRVDADRTQQIGARLPLQPVIALGTRMTGRGLRPFDRVRRSPTSAG
jgi:hypothetical protein